MTAEQIRESFSAALDGELDAEAQRAFDAALSADAALAAEYRAFAQFYAELRTIGNENPPESPVPDLLPGVQRRLRSGSRGRYYRDRFAERLGSGWPPTLVIGVVMLALVALTWIGLQAFEAAAVAN